MAEAPKAAVPAKKITRKRAGFRKVMVTLTEEQGKRLDDLATADDRGSATNMLTVLVKRNFAALVGSVKPIAPTFSFDAVVDDKPYTSNDPE